MYEQIYKNKNLFIIFYQFGPQTLVMSFVQPAKPFNRFEIKTPVLADYLSDEPAENVPWWTNLNQVFRLISIQAIPLPRQRKMTIVLKYIYTKVYYFAFATLCLWELILIQSVLGIKMKPLKKKNI